MLKIENLQVHYGGIQALRGISLEVPDGRIVTLIGANGAGKSTTLRTITGLVKASGGSVQWDGQELLGKSIDKIISTGIAMSPEGRRVFPDMTVLENLKIGDQALSKDLIDTIMAENGRDIESAKKPFADYEAIKEQLKTAQDGLKAFEGVDVKDLQDKIKTLNTQLSTKDKEWQDKLNGMAFDGKIKEAITAAKGRNAKAISALLDVEKLKKSTNQDADIKDALEALKKDNAYLFEDDSTPPPYAGGTGRSTPPSKYDAETAKIMAAAGLDPEKD